MNTSTNINNAMVDTERDMLSAMACLVSSSLPTFSFSSSQLTPPPKMNPPSNGYAGRALVMPSRRLSQNTQYRHATSTQNTSPPGASYHHSVAFGMGSFPLNGPAR